MFTLHLLQILYVLSVQTNFIEIYEKFDMIKLWKLVNIVKI